MDTSEIVDVGAKSITVHHKYVLGSFDHNVALIELQKAVIFSAEIKPACLNRDRRNTQKAMEHVGWGTGYFNGTGFYAGN